jgi:hypothetical protein
MSQPVSHKRDGRITGILLILVATAGWSTAGVWVKLVVEGSGISSIQSPSFGCRFTSAFIVSITSGSGCCYKLLPSSCSNSCAKAAEAGQHFSAFRRKLRTWQAVEKGTDECEIRH